ncbi:MAG: ATP-binding protein [Proteobacteria bacterium]|nr:ATP-binding protein [Pseudomonadota bacterium]
MTLHVFKNFKNFAKAKIELLTPLTLMIGRNGSGKSNVIEAVELLSQLAHGRPLYEITDIGRGGGTTFEVRGGLPGCLKSDQTVESGGDNQFSLGFSALLFGVEVNYSISIMITSYPVIFEEKLLWGRKTVFSASKGENQDILEVQYYNFKHKQSKHVIQLPSDRSVLSRDEWFAIVEGLNSDKTAAFAAVQSIESHLSSAFVFDLNPKQMRKYERIGQQFLLKDGSNLSSVLYGLSQDKKNQAALGLIFGRLQQLPEEPFESFEFVQTKLNDVLLAFQRSDGTLADARVLSDGSLRTLAILTALETVPKNSRIIIEEIDNGIHPSKVDMLVNAIWESSNRRNLNVLATSHNPATLNCLSPEQLKSVILCHYDAQSKSSYLTNIIDLPRAETLLERGQLGDLITRNVLEKYLVPHFDEEQKRKELAWLESLV